MMGEPRLKRTMDAAVGAAQDLVRQSHAVEGHVSPPQAASESERIRASVSEARQSLRTLASFSRTMDPAFSVPSIRGPPSESLSLEAQFREASRGNERPGRFFASAEAARPHSREEDAAARGQLRLRYPDARLVDGASARAPRAAEIERMAQDVRGWFGPAFLGRSLAARFSSFPPAVTGETAQFFRHMGMMHGLMGQSVGMQFPGTNHIAIDAEGIFEEDRYSGDAQRRCIIAHEMLHYAAMLGGGFNMRWRGPNGEPVIRGDVKWLHEGLTEFFAQSMARERGMAPASVAYGAETTVASYLQQLAGTGALRNAYLTGDMSEVRRLVDRQLGEGAFQGIIYAGSGAGAFIFVRERMESRGMGATLSRWDDNAIVKSAGVATEYRETEDARRADERDPNAIHGSR